MGQNASTSIVREIMMEFADLTGLLSDKVAPCRYLWTDAFAVCNFLELYHQTGDSHYIQLALHLVNQVHNVLGRHRNDDPRAGWISGLDEQEGRMHPTRGGLRIGKKMNERRPDELYDAQLEWDRDGQYYHYLTKWMHALNRVSQVTGESTYNRWAIELAKTAHAGFTYSYSFRHQKRMYWKMSIDLTCPLVSSMGHHDPLDGFITYLQLQATAAKDSPKSRDLDLSEEITDMADMCKGESWATDDPLGLGELLSAAYKLTQLIVNEDVEQVDLPDILLDAARIGLLSYERRNPLTLPADYRLAFRELGLSIGLHAIEKLLGLIWQTPHNFKMKHSLQSRAEDLLRYVPLGDIIEKYWHEPKNRNAESWKAHRDINMVMLATSLAPDGYLSI
ncbi:MAG: hypothetical protein FJ139_03760 [Deltaproteobacteria bacterium]|nr:hypothetical protein [Deltaproteobacteria bacterium]